MKVTVGVCITTHNRCEDLARTLAQLTRLEPCPNEIIVTADGCTDGTAEWLRLEYPRVRLIVHEQPLGSVASRNEMAAQCVSDVFLSVDDDSYPVETNFIARVSDIFEKNPKLAVASFPQRTDEFPETLTSCSFGPPQLVGSYANSSAAVRRSVFHELGGYPGFFFHAYEEPDFALRCVCAGWQVRLETSLTVRHHYSGAQRSELRMHHRHSRNELWSVLMRCPAPQIFAVALFRIVRQFGYASRRGFTWVLREPIWWFHCLRGVPHCLALRRPLPWNRYRAWMRLAREPTASESEWAAQFAETPR